MGSITKRGPCQFARIEPDKAGRVVMRADAAWPCMFPVEAPVFPASITDAYGYTWPPRRTHVTRESCAACPCWTARPV